MKRSILALLAGVILATSAHADILVKKLSPRSGIHYIHITNKITESDYDALVEKAKGIIENYPCSLWSPELVKKTRAHIISHDKCGEYLDNLPESTPMVGMIWFELNSIGGDIETALKIGRFLRAAKSLTMVGDDSICYSACVFILAGATKRYTGGKIGIHRPYEPNDITTSAAGQKVKYAKMGRPIKTYLSEMNVKPQLYDDMLYFSPESIRILSKKELEGYGLVAEDPFHEEADAVSMAKSYGISREEYGRRKLRSDKECWHGSTKFLIRCDIEILEGRR